MPRALHFSPLPVSVVILVLIARAESSRATVLTVDPAGGGFATIGGALDAAADGDTVLVKPGSYVVTSPIALGAKAVVLQSEGGPLVTSIRMAAQPDDPSRASVVEFVSGPAPATLDGFTISGGRGNAVDADETTFTAGGGVFFRAGAAGILTRSRVRGNAADRGGGVYCDRGSSPTLSNSTVAWNVAGEGGGIYLNGASPSFLSLTVSGNEGGSAGGIHAGEACDDGGSCTSSVPIVKSCIVWGNAGRSLVIDGSSAVLATYCLLRGENIAGLGNINADPLFCGWPGPVDVYVDAASPPAGDGTPVKPFATLAEALEFDFSLGQGSPCIGTGDSGNDMGAPNGTCAGTRGTERYLHVAAGRYSMDGLSLIRNVGLEGAGEAETVLEGTVRHLRKGESLSKVTVTAGRDSGLRILADDAPAIEDVTFAGNSGTTGGAVYCGDKAAPTFSRCKFLSNRAGEAGGAVYADEGSAPTFDACRFEENASEFGGAFYFARNAKGEIGNCVIVGNSARENGGAAACGSGSAPRVSRSTIVLNEAGTEGGGVFCAGTSAPVLTNVILWSNSGGSLAQSPQAAPAVTYSDVESPTLYPGTGNIDLDPQLCGYAGATDVHVDPASPGPGDGSPASPYPRIEDALAFSFALSILSPCLGTGENGVNMGADLGSCPFASTTARTVHLAAGEYAVDGLSFGQHVSIQGAGQDATVLRGTVRGLRTGAFLADLTVTGGADTGIIVPFGESPEIRDCVIRGNTGVQGGGVRAEGASPGIVRCEIAGNSAAAGGGIFVGTGTPTISATRIADNVADVGGGLYFKKGGASNITGTRIERNAATGGNGGGAYVEESTPSFADCVFDGNWTVGAGGGASLRRASPSFTHVTVSGNLAFASGAGIHSSDASPSIESSVVWGNAGGSLEESGAAEPTVARSCIEVKVPWAGEGNINANPLFLGWGSAAEANVDASSPGPGDGSPANPYRDVRSASAYSLSLAPGSPCIGTGLGGSNMGAPEGTSLDPPGSVRLLRLAAGTYAVAPGILVHGASVEGAGRDVTSLEGGVMGVRSGASIAKVAVTGGTRGGVFVATGDSPVISDCRIHDNSGPLGGGVTCASVSSPKLNGCEISGNVSPSGAGVFVSTRSSPVLTDCVISSNLANGTAADDHGGGLLAGASSKPRLVRCTVDHNAALTGGGGGVAGVYADIVLEDSVVSANWGHDGGGVYAFYGSARLTGCRITGNRGGYGGGVTGWYAPLTLDACEIAGNDGLDGGGVYQNGPEAADLVNCVIYGNLAEQGGGAAFANLSSTLRLTSCTVAHNYSRSGRGNIDCAEPSTVALKSCILWADSAGAPCGQSTFTLIGVDPLFVKEGTVDFARTAVAQIGGVDVTLPDFIVDPPDLHLRASSLAVDQGTCDGAPDVDITGRQRPQGAGCDMGAYERSPETLFVRGDVDGDRQLNLTDSIFTLTYLFLGGPEPGCFRSADIDASGGLNLTDPILELSYLFLGGEAPKPPFPACGAAPETTPLTCLSAPECE